MSVHDPYGLDSRRGSAIFRNAGFAIGLVGGVIMILIHLFMLLIYHGTNQGDVIAWIIEWFIYFFIARVAAQRQYNAQMNSIEATRGIRGAGVGAALITCIITWIFIIMRGVLRDAIGITITVNTIGLCVTIFLDALIALGLGSWAGRSIEKKYRTFNGY